MNKIYLIKQDFRRNWLILFIVVISIMPLSLTTYNTYVLFILLPIIFGAFSTASIWVCLFCLCYTIPFFEEGGLSTIFLYLFFPYIALSVGLELGKRFKYQESGLFFLVVLAIALALPAIFDNLKDYFQTGLFINITRSITNDEGVKRIGATGYGIMVSLVSGSLGMLIVKPRNLIDRRLKIVLLCFSLLGLFVTVHLINRTGLVIAAFSVVAALAVPPYNLKKIIYVISILVISIAAFMYLFGDSMEVADTIQSYTLRNQGAGKVSSVSGRGDRWMAGIIQLLDSPGGDLNGLRFEGHNAYAHNLWIDTGIIAGWAPMILLLIITFYFIKATYDIIKARYLCNFDKGIVLLFCCSYILQCMTEPIIEGCFPFFLYMFYSLGVLTSMNRKYIRVS